MQLMQVLSLLISEKPLPAHPLSTSMLNPKNTTFTWLDKPSLKNLLNNNLKFTSKTTNDASFVSRSLSHSNFHSPTWPGITPFSFPNKIIVSIKPNLFFICKKKSKSEWCAYFARTKVQKILQLVKLSECTCSPKIILSWKLKMGTKSMKLFTTFLPCSTKNCKNKSYMQHLWESTFKRSKSS